KNFEYKLSFTSSNSVANMWENAINPNSKTKWSGILIFGLQLEFVKKAHKAKNKNRELKSIENCCNSTIIKWAKKLEQIAIVNPIIPHEGAISSEYILLNKQIKANIKIMQVNLDCLEVEEDSADTDTNSEIEEEMIDVNNIAIVEIDRISAQRSIKDLLNYIILYLEQIILEIKTCGLFNNISQKIIVDEIKRIGIFFQFWEDNESHFWKYTLFI
ncbi:12621_t:CDS:2, partial [Gigaspora margarita]